MGEGDQWDGTEVALKELGNLQLVQCWDGDPRQRGRLAEGDLVLPEDQVLVEEQALVLLLAGLEDLLALLRDLGSVVDAVLRVAVHDQQARGLHQPYARNPRAGAGREGC